MSFYTTTGVAIGSLDTRYSKIIRVMREGANVDIQAYVISEPTPHNDIRDTRQSRFARKQKTSQKAQAKKFTLNVVLYGTMDSFEDVGDFLSQCTEYLQAPLLCDRNVPYRNPQSLTGRDHNPPMTDDFGMKLSMTEIETLAQAVDPSSVLETRIGFPETQAPVAVRTPLYRCVKRILNPYPHVFA